MGMDMVNDNSFGKSILRALLILEQFNSSNELGVKELSISTGLPASTVQRIVNTLELKNYLMQNPKNNKYRLGVALYNISRSYAEKFDWVESAKVHMGNLVEKHKENVNLGVLQGQKVVYLTKVESPHILRPNFTVGTQYPALCSALGKCLIAFQPTELIDTILSSPIEACTKNSITDPKKVSLELAKIRQQGYAIDNEEFQEGLFCIAAPIRGYRGKVIAAISTTIPMYRLDMEDVPVITKDLIETANKISLDLDVF